MRTAVVTGANTGLGKETARRLLQSGFRVVMLCRSTARGEEAARQARQLRPGVTGDGDVTVLGLDLGSLGSVRECAAELARRERHIHVLINNAGIMACPYGLTDDGFEMQFGVNHVGHFLLTSLLLPVLLQSTPARVVTVASHAHYVGRLNFSDLQSRKHYSAIAAYAQSKLANVLFSKELARRTKGSGVTSYCVHPGLVSTELGRHVHGRGEERGVSRRVVAALSKTPARGAETSLYCALSPGVAAHSGYYYSNSRRCVASPLSWGSSLATRLWHETEALVKER